MKKEKQRIIDWMYQLDFFSDLWYAKKRKCCMVGIDRMPSHF